MDTHTIITSNTGVQRIGKQVSSELPMVKDANVNVRDRLNDILLTEKHNLLSYQVGINEIINDDLRNIANDNRNSLQDIHTRFFNELFNLGEYQADVATMQQIKDTVDIFNNYKAQFPYK
jgi:hypothetical protein